MVHSPVWTFPISFLETICQYLNMSDSDMLTLSECSGHWRLPLIDYDAMKPYTVYVAHFWKIDILLYMQCFYR